MHTDASTPQWALDLQPSTSSASSLSVSKPKTPSADPPGYTSQTQKQRAAAKSSARVAPTPEEMDTLKVKKAWELAIAPAKALPMSAFGMYMTGNTLQIFSIFMVFTLFKTPVMAVLALSRTFAPFETPGTSTKVLGIKIVYVLMNMLGLVMGIWKVNQMGLLPTTRSDWLAWEGERSWSERALPREWL